MSVLNVFDLEIPESDEDQPSGFRKNHLQIGPLLEAARLGATVYEIAPGNRSTYHYEYNNEEWLFVLAGTPTLRTPAGEQRLRAGDLVAFTEGPDGAHSIANDDGELAARILMLSTKREPAVAVYPDSDKLAIWRLGSDGIMVRRSDAVEYWDGETP